jgi:hypothetical protein
LLFPIAYAGTMENDPNGFYGIRWGTVLAEVPNMTLAESGERMQTYELKQGPPQFGEATVETLRFIAIDGEFARVSIRYQGKQNHDRLLAYFQSLYGPLDRSPGSMVRGLNQQFNWRGPETEVNLTFEGHRERGYAFLESRTLAPKFNDSLPEHGC